MKRILVIALITAFTATAAFAQNLTLGGYFNSGLGMVMIGEDEIFLKAFGVDSDSNGYRFRLNGSYQNEERSAGARFRLQSQRTTALSGTAASGAAPSDHSHNVSGFNMYFSIPFAYGFANFFENKLGFSAGIVDDSSWQTADWWFNDDAGEGLGVLLKINPITGLNFGFGAYTIAQLGGGANNVLARNIDTRVDLENAKYTISASYTLKDAFYIGASFRTESTAGGANATGTTATVGSTIDDNKGSSMVVGDLRIFAVPNLTAVVAAAADNLQDFENRGLMFISETFAYKFNDELNIGINAVQFIYQNGNNMSMLFNLWGSYAFGNVVPRMDLVYFLNGTSDRATAAAASANPRYHRRGYAPLSNAAEHSVLSIRPSVRINLDGRTHFEIGNVTYIDSATSNQTFWGNTGERITNVFYLDFRWNF
ncbi:MAG: hypothetical protein FWC01_03585 [Treponema sp.]|nr:hypothetical protein [Treponema sp.]MCL2237839.1 hypothetical protein [Treponema sp.]